MKILLDIDGVMIPARPWQTYEMGSDGFGMFNKLSVNHLNNIIRSLKNTEIILTTSHKHSFTLEEWKTIFANRGLLKTKIERLKTNSLEMSRIEEIENWHLQNMNEKFIILDDDKGLNGLDKNIKEDHLVLTKATIGLNQSSYEEAILKLEKLNSQLAY